MYYVCLKTSDGYVTLSSFSDKKIAIGHKLDWYWLNVQYKFKILTKPKDGASENVFTEPCKIVECEVKKDSVQHEYLLSKVKLTPGNSKVFIEYSKPKIEEIKTKIIKEVAKENSFFLDVGEETLYKPVARRTRPNDSEFRKFLLTVDPLSPSIYAIRCKVNGMIYIGKSVDFMSRAKTHFEQLNKRSHENRYLQADWRIHGKHNFSIEVIEICSEVELTKLEDYFIEKFSHRAYNTVGNSIERLRYNRTA